MNNVNLDAFIIRYNHATASEIKKALQDCNPTDWQVPYLKVLLLQKKREEFRNKPIKIYHQCKSFIKNLITPIYKAIWSFWLRHWITLLPILVAFFGIIVTLFIYLDSKATTKAQQEINTIKNKVDTINAKQ
jgi:multidrug efflux pump subunit AcrB